MMAYLHAVLDVPGRELHNTDATIEDLDPDLLPQVVSQLLVSELEREGSSQCAS